MAKCRHGFLATLRPEIEREQIKLAKNKFPLTCSLPIYFTVFQNSWHSFIASSINFHRPYHGFRRHFDEKANAS